MKKITFLSKSVSWRNGFLTLALIACGLSQGQTTVFTDNFNRGNLNPGPIGTVYTSRSLTNALVPQAAATASFAQIASDSPAGSTGGAAMVTFNDNVLNLLQGGTAENGTISVSAPLTAFAAPFNTTLASNTGLLTWTFNLKTNRGTATGSGLSGFSLDGTGTNYGMAVVLAGTNGNLLQNSNGYVLTFHQLNSTSSNVVSLRKFNGGVYSCGTCPAGTTTMTTFIPAGTPLANRWNFISVKVTYNPTNDEWSLFAKDDGETNQGDATTLGTTDLVGTVVDNTYTTTPMTSFGFYYKHGVSNVNQNQAYFDNFQVTVGPNLSNNNFNKTNLVLFPNPVGDQLTISNDSSIESVSILNLLGQEVKFIPSVTKENRLDVDVSSLRTASYIIKITTVDGVSTSKFLKL